MRRLQNDELWEWVLVAGAVIISIATLVITIRSI